MERRGWQSSTVRETGTKLEEESTGEALFLSSPVQMNSLLLMIPHFIIYINNLETYSTSSHFSKYYLYGLCPKLSAYFPQRKSSAQVANTRPRPNLASTLFYPAGTLFLPGGSAELSLNC